MQLIHSGRPRRSGYYQQSGRPRHRGYLLDSSYPPRSGRPLHSGYCRRWGWLRPPGCRLDSSYSPRSGHPCIRVTAGIRASCAARATSRVRVVSLAVRRLQAALRGQRRVPLFLAAQVREHRLFLIAERSNLSWISRSSNQLVILRFEVRLHGLERLLNRGGGLAVLATLWIRILSSAAYLGWIGT